MIQNTRCSISSQSRPVGEYLGPKVSSKQNLPINIQDNDDDMQDDEEDEPV